MSVYKSRRKDASAQFIADARELRRMTARAVKRFPSSYRYIVTNGLLEMAREFDGHQTAASDRSGGTGLPGFIGGRYAAALKNHPQ